jgi:hypothetical protein
MCVTAERGRWTSTRLETGTFPALRHELLLMDVDQVDTIIRYPQSMLILVIHTVAPMPDI